MKRYDISTPRSGNISGVGGIHSFAVSFMVKKSGTVKASDLGLLSSTSHRYMKER